MGLKTKKYKEDNVFRYRLYQASAFYIYNLLKKRTSYCSVMAVAAVEMSELHYIYL